LNGDNDSIISTGSIDQGVEQDAMASELFTRLLDEQGIAPEDVNYVVATGYGRSRVSFAQKTITEITCHAVGVYRDCKDARTIVEIGGQDSKVLTLDKTGAVQDFAMNDRCAAGTGRFLEMVASRLGKRLDELGELAEKSISPAAISSMCVVFAETEIIGLLADGAKPEDIVAGVQQSIANRVCAMAGRNTTSPIYFTGGGARVSGMAKALELVINQQVKIAKRPQFTGAIGAAVLASRQVGNS